MYLKIKDLRIVKLTGLIIALALQSIAQNVSITEELATIENDQMTIEFDLISGSYSGTDKSDQTIMFLDATFLLDRGSRMWKTPERTIKAEELAIAGGKKLRVWYIPTEGYDPTRFLDFTIYNNSPFVVLGWGVKNDFDYVVRVRQADLLFQGKLFQNQEVNTPKVLRGGAGAEPNFVEDTWQIQALNSIMLTYSNAEARKTIVAGGYKYKEFYREIETHEGFKKGSAKGGYKYEGTDPYITLSISDPQGKRVAPKSTWESEDNFYLGFITEDPFEALENYGKELAKANKANPNVYNFPTLCGWMVSTTKLGEGKKINNSPALVEQMELARKTGLNKYTSMAVRLEPDYYCQHNQGNTQQGWWDDEHWAQYGSLQAPYETFSKFTSAVKARGGQVFTYFQCSMPSNDFALTHPEWMLNDDISLLHTDHYHHKPLIRYDYSNPDFQDYTLKMWKRLRADGVIGIKFDYPETAWAWNGGFDDKSYTTTSAYRQLFELCREGMGKEAYIHERILGSETHENVYRLDCTAGIVDLQRVWGDASHFEPEMASRMGLRWYKQGVVYRYYPDGKSFFYKGEALSAKDRRTFLTLIGLLSGRIELGTSIGSMTDEMFFDLTRLFPVLPNGKAFRPVDFLTGKQHPEVYVYDVSKEWKQVILINNSNDSAKSISAPFSGDQIAAGSLGFDADKKYLIYDFWNEKALGVYSGEDRLVEQLDIGEALVYAVRELKDRPQIIGTNRHVMCGMFEIRNEEWDEESNLLKFNASLIEGETMNITIHLPEDRQVKIEELSANNADASYSISDNYMIVSLLNNKKNVDTEVIVNFMY